MGFLCRHWAAWNYLVVQNYLCFMLASHHSNLFLSSKTSPFNNPRNWFRFFGLILTFPIFRFSFEGKLPILIFKVSSNMKIFSAFGSFYCLHDKTTWSIFLPNIYSTIQNLSINRFLHGKISRIFIVIIKCFETKYFPSLAQCLQIIVD